VTRRKGDVTDGLRYVVHAYAWTSSWSNDDLGLIDRAVELGLDGIEIPLMELDAVDPSAIRARAEGAGAALVTSVGLNEFTDPTSSDPAVRQAALGELIRCVDATAEMGATVFTGVTYSALGPVYDHPPTREERERAAEVLRAVARHAARRGVRLGIEPVNRYESFLVNTAEQALELKRLIGEDSVGVHLDAYHMNIEENGFHDPVAACVDDLVHFHLSESHRGTPGTGTVDWESIMQALVEGGYSGFVGLESFAEIADSMRGATCIWRDLAPDSDTLVRDGLAFLRDLERRARAAP
jgi:D-psicose/D-tagatose/L-ribulose 3-epimerase